MSAHLFVYPGTAVPHALGAGVSASQLPASPKAAARVIQTALADPSLRTLVFWDPRLGPVPWNAVQQFDASLDDVWHAGARDAGPDLLRFIQPLWSYRPDPDAQLAGAVHWKLDPRAAFLRAATVRAIGGFDPDFDTLAGSFLELGLRLLRRGAVCRQRPKEFPPAREHEEPPTLVDRYRLLRRNYGTKWLGYTAIRRVLTGAKITPELVAWRTAVGETPITPRAAVGALHREIADVALPDAIKVSIVLPTFGRYRYLAEVLEDIRAQTIRPTQILIADGNVPEDRDPSVYDKFRDLPIEVLWDPPRGICAPRNVCLERVTGDYVWFVDDDSRFDAMNLENHLRVLGAYGADVSVGPAYSKGRPELHGEQREIAVTHMDCGTTLAKRWLFDEVGGFDMQFNAHLAGEDGEIGIRFVRAGGLMVNNPLAKRFHYLAPVGGSRQSKNAVHYRWSRWSLLPRPVQSIYYIAKRHFEPQAAWDAMVQTCVLAGWRRRDGQAATTRWKVKTLLGELAAIPVTAMRLRRSILAGRALLGGGPQIPRFTAAGESRRGNAY